MTEPLKTWRNLTDLRKIAKDHNVVRPNIKQIPELLEELAQLDVAVSEVCESEMKAAVEPTEENQVVTNETVSDEPCEKDVDEADEPCEKDADEADEPQEKVTEAPETTSQAVTRLTKEVNEIEQALADKRQELSEAVELDFQTRPKPKSTAELIREQRAQEAESASDAVAEAQAQFLAGRTQKARQNMKEIMAEQMKKRG